MATASAPSSARYGVSATTAAIGSPTKRARAPASTGRSTRIAPGRARSGVSAGTPSRSSGPKARRTPGRAKAGATSTPRTCACACSARAKARCSTPSTPTSSMNSAPPSSSTRSSTRATRWPICLGRSGASGRDKVRHYTFGAMAEAEESTPMTSLIGRRMLRVEDRPLLTGQAEFVDDLELEGMLHIRFFRSPIARGKIEALDLEAARKVPGVVAVLGPDDVPVPPLHPPIENPDAHSPPRPQLAKGVVRFVGEAMAVIVADSPYAAEDAAELIEATLDPLPAVVDPLEAADAAAIHDHPTNILFDTGMEAGDVDGAFADAAVIVERTFRSPRYSATPMESRAAVAAPDGDGVRVWASTQIPHRLAEVISDLLHLDRARVRVSTMDVGGGFGQKAHAYPEEILTAWLALELDRPVKWLEDRSENLLASSHARDQVVRVRVAADGQGRLQAIDADVICDTGAYGVFPHGHILEAMGTSSMIPGPYRLANYRMRARSVA